MPARIDRAVGRLVEQGFELGEELFERIRMGRIRRSKRRVAPGLDRLLHAFDFVAGEIIGDHNIASLEGRIQQLPHIEQEDGRRSAHRAPAGR